ncbi:MAG TPA: asparagine synthetase B family protein [Fontimonas sp.]
MGVRFIALVGNASQGQNDGTADSIGGRLLANGMECCLSTPSLRLFLPPSAPRLALPYPDHGLIVGPVFSKRGRPIEGTLPVLESAISLHDRLLDNFWGEYLAFQVDSGYGSGFTVLRDPSGGIPCYYALERGRGFITSDISLAIDLGLCHREVNWSAIAHALAFPCLRTARTALDHVSELLPGCVMHHDESGVRVRTAWSPWRYIARDQRHSDFSDAATHVRSAISMVVKAWASVTGKSVMEVSGGLDSSIVAACLSEARANTVCCTLMMPVAGSDERQYAKMLTDAIGHDLHTAHVGFNNAQFDVPTHSWAIVPSEGILQRAVNDVWQATAEEHGAHVFLSGGGGDSIFCYLRTAAPAADAFKERGLAAAAVAVRDLALLHQCTFWKAARLTAKKLMRRRAPVLKTDASFLNPANVPQRCDAHPWLEAPPDALPGDREKVLDLTGTQFFRDATPRGEGRSICFPLLSQPVMEACLRVPTWMWIAQGLNRAVARAAFAGKLPDGILYRRSKGSHAGYMAEVYTRNKDAMQQFLGEGRLRSRDLLDWPALERYFGSDVAARDLSFTRIFDLCMVESWVRGQAPS